MKSMKVALLGALAFHADPKTEDMVFTPLGNHYPTASKSKGHAARQKRQSKKRKAK